MKNELFIDNFAGGGGASTGIEIAIGRHVDIAINHDPDAIAMHKVNHPNTKHYCEDVWEVEPEEACNGNPVALAWFSPDCKHFSRAKGGKPVDKNIRGLAWVAIKWALKVRPRVIMLENVPEIVTWCPLGEDNKPIKERLGETFDGFIHILSDGLSKDHPAFIECCNALDINVNSKDADTLSQGLGYKVDFRELLSCDYGAPTKRNRFYMVARCDGKPIVWPKATHADRKSDAVKSGKLKPWIGADYCLDFNIPMQSIFERDKPLAENTLKRIARGIRKFVIDNPEPFIISVNHSGNNFRGQDLGEPLNTLTAKNGYAVVTPTIMSNNTGHPGADIETPLPTITTGNKNYLVETTTIPVENNINIGNDLNKPIDTVMPGVRRFGLIAPSLIPIGYGERDGQAPRVNSVKEPLGTIVSSGKHYLTAPTLIQYHAEQSENEVRGQKVDEPIMTIDGSPRYALSVAHIMKYYAGQYKGAGSAINEPLHTVTAEPRHYLAVTHIMKNYGGGYKGAGSEVEAPLDTITAIDHNSLVASHIMTMRNNMDGQAVDEPLSTISCKDHHAAIQSFLVKYMDKKENLNKDDLTLVKIQGVTYQIVDISMRMLQPHELFRCQGFPDTYIIDRDAEGNPYPKSKQTARCGNAVTPQTATALVRVNLPEYCIN